MQLTEQELKHITPGIYRTSFSFVNGVPGLRDAEFESADITRTLTDLVVSDQTQEGFSEAITGSEDVGEKGHFPKRTYFPSIDSFLDAWKRGYESGVSQFGTNPVYNKLGFELFYTNWHPGSEFFSFGDHEGIQHMGDRADLNPLLILGDNNGMNDQRGYLNLGVNDFRNLKVLVYRESDEEGWTIKDNEQDVDLSSSNPKQLRTDIRYYVWPGENEFPFHSPNSLKSAHNMWTAVGISPLEIYSSVEKFGFVFPTMGKKQAE
ncbi:hypothetical protein ISS07_06745 [Candidatus Woesearchaeota archaeon]|nr:hypothetical protein [Candidatus Woesearchaeota archaeon]